MLKPRSLVTLTLILLAVAVCFGQTFTGTILGIVNDSSGATVAGARASILETETNLRRQTTSDKNGNFELPLLQPGTYQLEVELTGFKKFVRTGLTLEISQK